MKHLRLLIADARRHQGLALIIVLSMLALATIVILAFLSVADTEHKATNVYASSQSARRFADTAVNMVIGQIRAGSAREQTGVPVIHATQPGAVRKYSASGDFLRGYKLFSDRDMIYYGNGANAIEREQNFVSSSEPPANWNQEDNVARYVDLNDPVIKGVATNAEANQDNPQIYFPVIDPRAGQDMDPTALETPAEGFSYALQTAMNGNGISQIAPGQKTAPIVLPSGATQGNNIDQLRLAMPVQWLYILKDGAVGYLNDNLEFRVMNDDDGGLGNGPSVVKGADYGVPSEANPIVGRIAFWTDDESCKINVNTASEPTFAGQPVYYHERDRRWADYPPARGEYQRFPGHPATVALSSVLYPNPLMSDSRSLETYGSKGGVTGATLERVLTTKERIYDLMPKIHTGGSYAGTRTFERDQYTELSGDSSEAIAVAIKDAMNERLFSSVDELFFSQKSDSTRRIINDAQVSPQVVLYNKNTLERASAFLTAHSRASEINLFGLPRIAMWPLPVDPNKRTGFDNLMEFCAKVGGQRYMFQREYGRTLPPSVNGARHDISIQRNLDLLNMLDRILDNPFPTATDTSGSTARSFKTKLGDGNQTVGNDNVRQLLVSMFDYIRCINIYDSYLVPDRGSWAITSYGNSNWVDGYRNRENYNNGFKTYTVGFTRRNNDPDNAFNDRPLPGHGQITPSLHPQWRVGGNNAPMKGFGRFVSLSEIGLHFICTADGQPDMYSWRIPELDPDTNGNNGEENVKRYRLPAVSNWTGLDPNVVSGGRTALQINESEANRLSIASTTVDGLDPNHIITNLAENHWVTSQTEQGSIKARYYSNYPPLSQVDQPGRYGTSGNQGTDGDGANYWKYYLRHPGYQPDNWNWTLTRDLPLAENQKRIQAMLHLEFFCPSVGYVQYTPDYTVVISGKDMSNIIINGQALFSSDADVALHSDKSLFATGNSPETGGFASFRNVALGRRVAARGNLPDDTGYVKPTGSADVDGRMLSLDFVSSLFDVTSNEELTFFTTAPITLKIYDRHVLASTNEEPVQTIQVSFPPGKAPSPDLVVTGSYRVNYQTSAGAKYFHPPIQAPRWWSFNRDGALGRADRNGALIEPDKVSPKRPGLRGRLFNWDASQSNFEPDETIDNGTRAVYNPPGASTTRRGNQSVPGARSIIYGKDSGAYYDVELQDPAAMRTNIALKIGYGSPSDPLNRGGNPKIDNPNNQGNFDVPWHYGSDVIRTLQPKYGDARLIAAKSFVTADDWVPHRLWSDPNEYMAHNLSSYSAASEPGFDRGVGSRQVETAASRQKRGLPADVNVSAGFYLDAPHGDAGSSGLPKAAYEMINRYYDFDDSDPGGRPGPFINKVDEGNYAIGEFKLTGWSQAAEWRSTYFRSNGVDGKFANGKGSYFTPNRMVSSPAIMGSLPSRIWSSNGDGAWTNLLFRPYVQYTNATQSAASAAARHVGQESPPDHYLLDLFWMPVVEPYAISEPLSTAGKINLNYQMLPFTHIRRATAVHAAMKGEYFAALPNADFSNARNVRTGWTGSNGSVAPLFRNEARDNSYWHRGIVVDRFAPESQLWWQQNVAERVQGTLRQFEERFNFGRGTGNLPNGFKGGLFRTASQICEIHLIPSTVTNGANVSASEVSSYASRQGAMAAFWSEHCATGDNTRERPYSNLYAKFTTRSNTFRVHVRAQTILKARRSVASDVFDPDKDEVSSEYRGSFLLERYIDQADIGNLDYATTQNPFSLRSLESFYRFRVIESKRFAP